MDKGKNNNTMEETLGTDFKDIPTVEKVLLSKDEEYDSIAKPFKNPLT